MPGLCREFRCSTPLPPQTCSPGRTVFFPLTRASASRSWTATCRTISVASNISCGIAPGPLRTRATLGDPRRRRPHHPRPLRAAPALWPPTGSALGAGGSPRARGPMASSNSRHSIFWTGSRTSCRRATIGTGITGRSRRVTASQHQHPCRPSSALGSIYIGKRAEPVHSLLYLLSDRSVLPR